jgi:FeS assembly SUF system protein
METSEEPISQNMQHAGNSAGASSTAAAEAKSSVDAAVSLPQHLPVLPHSGKVDKLREEAAASGAANSAGAPPAAGPWAASHSADQPASRSPTFQPGLPSVTPLDFGHAMHRSPEQLAPAQRSLEATIVEVIRTVYDPEIPVNVYDLGLIYAIDIDPDNVVKVQMTLTAPGCPVAGSLPVEVERKIEAIPQVKSAEVELTWDPPWDKSRMSEAALLDLGLM